MDSKATQARLDAIEYAKRTVFCYGLRDSRPPFGDRKGR